MKIGLFCYDGGGGNAMESIAKVAENFGHLPVLFPKQVRGCVSRVAEMADCDVVVTGLSSFQTQEELDLVAALPPSIPWVMFEDVPGVCGRPMVKEHGMISRASAVIMALPGEREDVLALGYADAVYLGPPPQWRGDHEKIMAAVSGNKRSEMRKRLGEGLMSVLPDDVVIGLIGGKDPAENNRVIKIVLGAIAGTFCVLAFGKHPGEKPEKKLGMSDEDFEAEEARFARLFAERQMMLDAFWVADTSDTRVWNGPTVAGVSRVLVSTSGSNITAAMAIAGRAQVHLDDEGVRRRLSAQTGGDGSWFVAEMGGALKATDPNELYWTIQTLLTPDGRAELSMRQSEVFPLPHDWNTEAKIVRWLEEKFSK